MNDRTVPFAKFLGHVAIEGIGGLITTFRSNRIPELLAFLAVNPGMHPREYVATRLWPESEGARQNLRQTLLYVKDLFAEKANPLEATRLQIGLRPGALESDVGLLLATELHRDFEDARRTCERAVEAYRGPFLPGIEDEWVQEARNHLCRVYVRAAIFLADAEMDDNPAKALEYAEKAIVEEPMMNGPRARKIAALMRLGEAAAAHLEYESFAELLDHEIGADPAASVREALDAGAAKKGVHGSVPIGDLPDIPSDLDFALASLESGDRPQYAVRLAVALTPHWIAVGTPGRGIDGLIRAVENGKGRLTRAELTRAKICLFELRMAQGDISAGRLLLAELQAGNPHEDPLIGAKLCLMEARLLLVEVRGKAAMQVALAGITLLDDHEDSVLKIDLLCAVATSAVYGADYQQAIESGQQVVALAKQLGERLSAATGLFRTAQALDALGRREEAEACARESLDVIEGTTSPAALMHRLSVARLMEDLDLQTEAEAGYRHVLAALKPFESRFTETLALTYLGDLTEATERHREAASLHRRALEIRRELRQDLGAATSLRGLGRALHSLGDLNAAREALLESAHLFAKEDAMPGYASALLALAHVEERAGDLPLASRLARRARKLLLGMTIAERKSNGPSGLGALADAESLIRELAASA